MSAKKRVVHQKSKGPIDPAVGQKVRELRIERGMTQAALAGPDFSKGFISLLEAGRTRVSLRAAVVLASRLGVEAADFLGAIEPPAFVPTANLDENANQALREMYEIKRIPRRVLKAEALVKEALRTHAILQGKLKRITDHLKKWPDPRKFTPEEQTKFIEQSVLWHEQLWTIVNEQPRRKGR